MPTGLELKTTNTHKVSQVKSFELQKQSFKFTWHSLGVTIRSSESEGCHRHYDTSKSFPFTKRQLYLIHDGIISPAHAKNNFRISRWLVA